MQASLCIVNLLFFNERTIPHCDASYLKRGESLRHSSKSSVTVILPSGGCHKRHSILLFWVLEGGPPGRAGEQRPQDDSLVVLVNTPEYSEITYIVPSSLRNFSKQHTLSIIASLALFNCLILKIIIKNAAKTRRRYRSTCVEMLARTEKTRASRCGRSSLTKAQYIVHSPGRTQSCVPLTPKEGKNLQKVG